MAIVGELLTILAGNNTQLLATIGSSEAALRGYSGTAATQGGIVSGAFKAIGVAAIGIGAATVVGAAVAAHAAGEFQEQMAVINTIAHQTPTELDATGEAIRRMAVSTGTPLSDLTKAFYDILSAGVPVSQAMAVLGQATTLAIGGLATTTQTVDLLTTAINTYHLDAQGAATATDQFALAVQNGKVTADQIAATFADVAPLARTVGVGIDEIAAGYAHFTANGVPAAEFTTQMNRAMTELLKPNADLNALQEKTGQNFADIAGSQGLVVALQQMREAAEANGVPFQDLFGRLEGLKFALQTTGPEFQAYQSQLTAMHDANGTAAGQAAERMGTFSRQTAILGASLNDLLITVGTPLLPFLTSLVQNISGGIQAVSDWAAGFGNLGAAMASLIPSTGPVGAALSAIGTAIGQVIGAIVSFVTNVNTQRTALDGVRTVITGVQTGLGILGEAIRVVVGWLTTFATHLTGTQTGAQALNVIMTATGNVLGTIATVVGTVVGALITVATWIATNADRMGVFRIVGDLVNATFGSMGTHINNIITFFTTLAGVVSGVLSAAFTAAKTIFNSIVTAINAAITAIKALVKGAQDAADAISKIPGVKLVGDLGHAPTIPRSQSQYNFGRGDVPAFAEGGIMPGSPGQAGLAILHGGEKVTPAGDSGGTTHLTHTTVIQMDGRTLGQIVEEILFKDASSYSSGFSASPGTTGV